MGTIQSPSIFARRESEARSYCRRISAVFDTAEGSVLTDSDGRRYIDFLAGAGSLNYGHNDPDMCEALVEYVARKGVAHSLDLHTTEKERFLEVFERLILEPRDLDHRVQFCGPTGTNAVEAALKLARKVTGRINVIAFTNGFHGVTLGALAATANQHNRGEAAAIVPGITRLPYDGYVDGMDTAALLEQLLDDPSSGVDAPAAILLETIQGEGGINVASPAWLRRVAELAERHDALLIVDDIQAGCGRTGDFFSFEDAGIVPDIITLSKSLSGLGLPLAAVLVRPHLDKWAPGEHNGTFRGANHSFVTARVALEKFWADTALSCRVKLQGQLVSERLYSMAESLPDAQVRGRGMFRGLDVRSGELASQVCELTYKGGLLIETAGSDDQVLKIMAPLTIHTDMLTEGLDQLEFALSSATLGSP